MDTQGNPGDYQADQAPSADSGIIHYPRSGFGRGWIPAGRDIGVPGEDLPSPLVAPAEAGAHPDLAREGEGGVRHESSDGPLPAQGAVYPERLPWQAAEGQGRREEGEGVSLEPALRHDGWTPVRKARFLDHLASQGNVRAACAAVGMSPEAAYKLRRREAVFAAAWAGALVLAREAAEQVLADRALNGVSEPIFYRGEQVGSRVKHDTRLLLAHLARLDEAARDAAAQALAERFDELVALVAGAEIDPAMLGEDGLPLTREAYAEQVQEAAEIETEAALREAGTPMPGYSRNEDCKDPVWIAAQAAHAQAGAAWDAWRLRAHAAVDGGEGEAPIEFKSLDPVNSIHFVNFAPAIGRAPVIRHANAAAMDRFGQAHARLRG